MAFQKSLTFVALVVMLGIFQEVSGGSLRRGYSHDDIDEAISILYSSVQSNSEDTEHYLEFIRQNLENQHGLQRLTREYKYREMLNNASDYLDYCEEIYPRQYKKDKDAKKNIEAMILEEKRNENSKSIINYLEECMKRRFGDN